MNEFSVLAFVLIQHCCAKVDAEAAAPNAHRLVLAQIYIGWKRVVLVADVALERAKVNVGCNG